MRRSLTQWIGLSAFWAAALVRVWAVPPPNDSFESPTLISGFPALASGSNLEATLELSEPTPDNAEASVWFQWTAVTSGVVQIDTQGSDFDTLMAVVTGSAVDSLELIAENDDYTNLQSAVFVNVVSGFTYQIAVYGYISSRGAITLNITHDIHSQIQGTVTGPDDRTPLPGIRVVAFEQMGGWWGGVGSGFTDGDGRYRIGGLPAGTYRVQFDDSRNGDYLSEVWSNAPDLDSGWDIEVPEETTVTDIDASLAVASKISGTVTGPDEITPLPGIQASAHRWNGSWWDQVNSGNTDGNGFYTIVGLPAGTYRVQFSDWQNGDYVSEVWSNAPDLDSGWDIEVPEETTVTDIDASLAAASRITGTVTGPDESTLLSGIQVSAHVWNGSWWNQVSSGNTDGNGAYTIGGLPAGTYRVQFGDWQNGDYVSEVWSNAPDLESGLDVVLPEMTTVSGIDASLAAGSKITGTVTGPDESSPLSGIQASAYRWNGSWWEQVNWGNTDGNGAYTIGGLPAGTYRIQFDDWQNGDYVSEVWSNAPDLDSGWDVVLPELTTVSGIDASLAAGSKITGTVTGPDDSTPLSGIQATAYRWTGFGWDHVNSDNTDDNGNYTIGGLPAGSYRVRFDDWQNGDYSSEVWSNAPDLNSGMDIEVPEVTTISDINASLAAASKITGTVIGPDDSTPLPGIQATAYRWTGSGWDHVNSGNTDGSGVYTIGGLPAGTYRVRFDDWQNGDYASEVWSNAPDLNSGTDIEVPELTTVIGIDASLSSASKITGTVTGPDGSTLLPGIDASAHRWDGAEWVWVNSGNTDGSGNYTINGLPAGTYRVQFNDWQNGDYVSEVWSNAPALDSGDDIEVTEGMTRTGIDASLADSAAPPFEPIKIVDVRRTGVNQYAVRFTGAAGEEVYLQEKISMTNSWGDVGLPFIAQPGTNIVPIEHSARSAFWRVKRTEE
jgi:Ni/Co efflux regulator RcnB